MPGMHLGITADGSQAVGELARVQAAIDKLSGKTVRVRVDVDGTGKAIDDMQGLTKATQDLTRAERAHSRASAAAARNVTDHGAALELAGDAARRYGGDVDRVGRSVDHTGKSIDRTGGDVDRASRSVDDFGDSTSRVGRSVTRFGGNVAGAGSQMLNFGGLAGRALSGAGMAALYATAGSALLTAGVAALGVGSAASLGLIGVGMGAAAAGVTGFAVDSLKEVDGFKQGFESVGRAVQGYSAWISAPYGAALLRMADASANSAPAIAAPLRQAMSEIGDTAQRGLPGILAAAAQTAVGAQRLTTASTGGFDSFFRNLPALAEASIDPMVRVASTFSTVSDRAFSEGVPAYRALASSVGAFGSEIVQIGADHFAPTLRGLSSLTDGATSMAHKLRPAIDPSIDAVVDLGNAVMNAVGNSTPEIASFARTVSDNSYGLQRGLEGAITAMTAVGETTVKTTAGAGPLIERWGGAVDRSLALADGAASAIGGGASRAGGWDNLLSNVVRSIPGIGPTADAMLQGLGFLQPGGGGGFGAATGGHMRGGMPGQFSGLTARWRPSAAGGLELDLPAGAAEEIQRIQNRIDAGGLSAGQVKQLEQSQRYAARGVDPSFAFKGRPGGAAEYGQLVGGTSADIPASASGAAGTPPGGYAGRPSTTAAPRGGPSIWSTIGSALKDFTFGSLGNLFGGGAAGAGGGSMIGRMLGSMFSGATSGATSGMIAPGLGGGGFGAGISGAAQMTNQMRSLAGASVQARQATSSFGTATSGAMAQASASSAGVATMRTQVQSVAPAVQAARATIVPAATSLGAAIPQAVGQGVTPAPVTSAMRTVVRSVSSMSGSAGDAGQSMGASIGSGAGQGITKSETKTVTVIRRWVKKIVDAGMGALDASSPSRVFMAIGGFIGDGLALGVEQSSAGAISATRQMGLEAGLAGGLGAAVGLASDGVRGIASDRGLQVGYSWARSVVDGADRVLKTADFKAAGIPQVESPQAKAALGALGLLGPAGSGAQIWKTPMVTLGGDGASAPTRTPIVVNVLLDGQPFRQYTVDALDTFANELADSIGRQVG